MERFLNDKRKKKSSMHQRRINMYASVMEGGVEQAEKEERV